MNAVICVIPEIKNNFITTLPTPKLEVPITMYPSINGISRLVSMNECVVQTRSTYCDLFISYIYSQQQDMLHPSTVGVLQLIHCQFLSGISPKRSGN